MIAHHRIPATTDLFSEIRQWWSRFRCHLQNPRFWIVQGFVLLATGLHLAGEHLGDLSGPGSEHVFVVVLFGFYTLPIVYASLNFGLEGALPTAIWAGLLLVPDVLIWHEGIDRIADVLQHAVVITLAVIIATRVDREIAARCDVERAMGALHDSEMRYRAIFETVGEAVLVLDRDGRIENANAAASALFGIDPEKSGSCYLPDVIGEDAAATVWEAAAHPNDGSEIKAVLPDGGERWLEPVWNRASADDCQPTLQVLFHDVTDRRQRQRGLEAYARQIISAQEEERRRIARDLHDGPVQELILLCRQLDEMSNVPQGGVSQQAIYEIRRFAEGIAAEVRRVSRNLRPSILDDLGLVPAVRWFTKDVEQRTRIHVTFKVSAMSHRMTPDAELCLFRIAQEALHNVERHAEATKVDVALAFMPNEARLTVSDNGQGMKDVDPSSGTTLPQVKLGMLGMAERARFCGGTLVIESQPGAGTRVDVVIPTYAASEVNSGTEREHSMSVAPGVPGASINA